MKKIIFFTALIAAAAIVFCPQAMAVGTPAGTVIQNQAYADYNDANGNPKTRVYSDWVYTTVSQVAGVEIMPETASQSGMAGDTVYFVVTVTNTGNGTDTFALGVTDTAWSSVIYLDDNGDGIWDEMNETTVVNTTGPLAADTSYKVIVVTTIPIDAEDMATSIATLTATSQFNNAVSDIGTYTTTAESAVFDVVKYVVDTPENPVPGDIITYKITGTNAGSAATDNIRAEDAIPAGTTYVAGSMRVGMIGDSYSAAMPITDADDGNEIGDIGGYFTGTKVVYTKGAFAPAGTGSFFFQVQVNEGVLETTVISNQLTAYYKHENLPTEYTSSSNTTSTTIGLKAAVDLDPDGVKYNINPGDQVIYPFTATNNGNAADRINVTTSSTMAWTWAIWVDSDANGIPGTNGDYLLADTNADGIIDTGILTPNGGSINLLAVATVPAGTYDGAVDVTTVTGTSVRDNTVSDSITLTTNVIAPVLSISKSVSPEGNQPPGTVLTYTVTVTNTGHGTATSVAIFDLVPTYTTFVPGSIYAGPTGNLVQKTDASDGDGGRYDSNSNTVSTGTGTAISLGYNGTWVLQFQVTID